MRRLEGGGDTRAAIGERSKRSRRHIRAAARPSCSIPRLKDWVYDLTPERDLQAARTYSLEDRAGRRAGVRKRRIGRALHRADPHLRSAGDRSRPPRRARKRFRRTICGRRSGDRLQQSARSEIGRRRGDRFSRTGQDQNADDAFGRCPVRLRSIPMRLTRTRRIRVTVAATVKDVFGQTLGQARNLTFRTGDFAPGAWAPTGTSVIPAGRGVALNFYATNLPGNRYQAAYAKVPAQKLFNYPDPLTDLPAYAGWPQRSLPNARRNVQSVVPVTAAAAVGGTVRSARLRISNRLWTRPTFRRAWPASRN